MVGITTEVQYRHPETNDVVAKHQTKRRDAFYLNLITEPEAYLTEDGWLASAKTARSSPGEVGRKQYRFASQLRNMSKQSV